MPRQRMLHPKFFTDSRLLAFPPLHRLLFQALWCEADREGRLSDQPIDLKIRYLPMDPCDVNQMLQDLHEACLIIRYDSDKGPVIAIPKFGVYQHPHPKEPVSTLPASPEKSPANSITRLAAELHGSPPLPPPASRAVTVTVAESVTVADLRVPRGRAKAPAKKPRAAPVRGAVPRETGQTDPRHKPLLDALLAVDKRTFRPRDAASVKALLALGDPAEVERRWRRALGRDRYPLVRELHELEVHWNHFATDEPAGTVRGQATAADTDWANAPSFMDGLAGVT